MKTILFVAMALLRAAPLDAQSIEEFRAAGGRDFVRLQSMSFDVVAMSRPLPRNIAELPGRLFRGAELESPEQYENLKRVLRVDLVVNLREDPDDMEACRGSGLECAQFPIRLFWPFVTNIDWEILRSAFHFVLDAERQGRAVYFHCQHGSDRTGALAAALAVRRGACGKDFAKDILWAEVDGALKRHGFHESWFPALGRDIKNLVYEFEKNEPWLCR